MPDEKIDFRVTDGPISYCRVPEDKIMQDCDFWEPGIYRCRWMYADQIWCRRMPLSNNQNDEYKE